ncbi:GGDEF domain-containing protein [Breznakiella homolactica]|uniref:diguanylate cyclase n=1 Tax=Breznakiella homolactica TaxID=2798577 RepID=A0A7T8BC85_9SPIR|nr:diguanylate cyclase [Breznakiella homolactica]QQO11166.1 diguanylate cyclase [Breznakiella homolactica]
MNENDLTLYIILGSALLFAFLVHVGLLVFSIFMGIPALIIHNSISIVSYGVAFYLLREKHPTVAGIILSAEVLTYGLASVFWFGIENYILFYFLMVLVMQIIIPYAKPYIRASIGAGIGLILAALLIVCPHVDPVFSLGRFAVPLMYFNIVVGFAGISVELLIGNFIKKIMENLQQKQIETLESHAYTDSLTGLFNRHYSEQFFKQLREKAHESGPYCVAMLDIDDFKKINDTHGHGVGDKVLIDLSAIIQRELRKTDTIIRWGGEEFLIILNDVDLKTARSILDKLRLSIADHVLKVYPLQIKFTVTMGVTKLDLHNIDASIVRCDKYLYKGKKSGKNKVVFS